VIEIDLEGLRAAQGAAVLGRFLSALSDDNLGFDELAEIVRKDAAMAAKVLKIANSSYYGLGGAVDNLVFACAVIGVLGLRSLTIHELSNRLGNYPRELARESEAVAEFAFGSAEQFGVDKQVGLGAGLVVTIGRILMAQQDPEGYFAAKMLSGEDLLNFQRDRYGETWLELSCRALASWNFPTAFIEAIGECLDYSPSTSLGALLGRALREARLSIAG
jgi:HD-like signal output (HDOD) protein